MTTRKNETAIATVHDDAKHMARRINEAHRACQAGMSAALQHALTAGRLLMIAKDTIHHGGWLKWLAKHCELSPAHGAGLHAIGSLSRRFWRTQKK